VLTSQDSLLVRSEGVKTIGLATIGLTQEIILTNTLSSNVSVN